MPILDKAYQLQLLLSKHKFLEALDTFYHEEVTVTEMPTGEQRFSKSEQRESILHWLGMVKSIHKRKVCSICVNEERNLTTVETWMEVTFKDGEHYRLEEVAIQHWEDGLIVEEKFYYHLPEGD